jgi:hypothetical protein
MTARPKKPDPYTKRELSLSDKAKLFNMKKPIRPKGNPAKLKDLKPSRGPKNPKQENYTLSLSKRPKTKKPKKPKTPYEKSLKSVESKRFALGGQAGESVGKATVVKSQRDAQRKLLDDSINRVYKKVSEAKKIGKIRPKKKPKPPLKKKIRDKIKPKKKPKKP